LKMEKIPKFVKAIVSTSAVLGGLAWVCADGCWRTEKKVG